jgi:hypothetical protein
MHLSSFLLAVVVVITRPRFVWHAICVADADELEAKQCLRYSLCGPSCCVGILTYCFRALFAGSRCSCPWLLIGLFSEKLIDERANSTLVLEFCENGGNFGINRFNKIFRKFITCRSYFSSVVRVHHLDLSVLEFTSPDLHIEREQLGVAAQSIMTCLRSLKARVFEIHDALRSCIV